MSSILSTIDRAFVAAGLNPNSARLQSVTDTIKRALAAAGIASPPQADASASASATTTLRSSLRETAPRREARGSTARRPADVEDLGQFLSLQHSNGAASRDYKLYVPASYRGEPVPLIVMLHGCKQNPDDFAAGTRMNELAEQYGFLVAYPAQTRHANGANCWNWFKASEQNRGGEEVSLIAGIVSAVARSHRIDEERVFVAGLSAGAAMAVILGAAYPEVFAAVAAHSGLPRGAAHDVPSAFAAMRGRRSGPAAAQRDGAATARKQRRPGRGVPTIVFHGDSDPTVAASNGGAIVEEAVSSFREDGDLPLHRRPVRTASIRGRDCTTTRYIDPAGRTQVEEWVVHGGSHAWFGGDAKGSYTDSAGPDASAEIVRFFLALNEEPSLAIERPGS